MQLDIESLKNEYIYILLDLLYTIHVERSYLQQDVRIAPAYSWVGDIINNIANNLLSLEEDVENILEWIKQKIIAFEKVERDNINLTEHLILKLEEQGIDVESMSVEEFFDFFSKQSDSLRYDYGIDQGILQKHFFYEGDYMRHWNGEFTRLELLVMDKYNMSSKEASLLLTTINTIGVCTYASTANNIVAEFIDNPKEFEELFGFPMIRENEDGEIVLNSEELLIDLYVHANSKDHHYVDINGEIYYTIDSIYDITESGMIVDKDMIEYDEKGRPKIKEQQYSNLNNTNEYIKAKNSQYEYEYTCTTISEFEAFGDFYDEMEQEERQEYKLKKVQELRKLEEQGYQLEVSVIGDDASSTFFTLVENDYIYELNNGGHRMKITEITEEGVYCSTWGRKAFLTYDEILTKPGNEIYCARIVKR